MDNKIRILFDMQACQAAGSSKRGVGMFSSSLMETLSAISTDLDIYTLVSSDLSYEYIPANVSPTKVLKLDELPDWHTNRSYLGGEGDKLDGMLVSVASQSVKPDVIHLSHVFEGYGERIGIFDISMKSPEQIVSATLYDFIPLIFSDLYLKDENFRKWYMSRLALLRQVDLLLAISESTRQDAVKFLGISPDKIVTINGGIREVFKPVLLEEQERVSLFNKFRIKNKFVLYTGGDDHRKNIKGAIAGFSMIARDLIRETQLVIVCQMSDKRKSEYLEYAHSFGLDEDDVLITGYVEENDLVLLYNLCNLFIFPSLYEGLGLPVLEAMSCGAPVIGSNNSSIREIIGRQDMLFEANDHKSIALKIQQVLLNSIFSKELREYGIDRAKQYSWEKSAKLAENAFQKAMKNKRNAMLQAASNSILEVKRLAVATPLPPCKSGIADYNSKFIPYLAKYFNIDLYVDNYTVENDYLNSAFRIFDVKDFPAVANSYDLILYEFGNSEFHVHMIDLLKQFPGVVGLHDAYLSGLIGYRDFNLGDHGYYVDEMLCSHGSEAKRLFAPANKIENPISKAMIDLPCTKSIIDSAIGVISHSQFNLDVASKYYPQGWCAPYRIIPQMVELSSTHKENNKFEMRTELGFRPDDIIISSFGHIAWTKVGDILLQAFTKLYSKSNSNIFLIFVGELSNDDFGRSLKEAIESSELSEKITITGFISEDEYTKYLDISDLAVQLRIHSRGGTPKGVLDCLSHGLPVIVNNDASYKDYPDDVVIKISSAPTIESLYEKLNELLLNRDCLSGYSERGVKYIRDNHLPDKCASEYAATLNEFLSRDKLCSTDNILINYMVPHIGGTQDALFNANLAKNWLLNMNKLSWNRRRLYIDVSHISKYDHNTGIQRVVKEIVKSLYINNILACNFEPIAVVNKEGGLYQALEWLESRGLSAKQTKETVDPIEFNRGDILLMLDSSWAEYSSFESIFESARAVDVPIITAIYDLLPITLSPDNFVDGGREWFEEWFKEAILNSDGLICISKSVADDAIAYISSNKYLEKEIRVGYWHLGSDFENESSLTVNDENNEKVSGEYLLAVGTIEPRKSHELMLDTFELLWKKNIDLKLCIAGKKGWLVDDFIDRIKNHEELGQRLIFIESPSDIEVAELYSNASGLLLLSKGEGFGLPLIEAAFYEVPVICSNLEVFKEIAGDYATYVDLKTPGYVSEEILKWCKQKESGDLPDSSKIQCLNWEQSTKQLVDVIVNSNWYHKFRGNG